MPSDSAAPLSQPVIPLPILHNSPSSASLIYTAYNGNDINDALLDNCARLFSQNYGIWGKNPSNVKGPKPGSVLVVCYQPQGSGDLELVGHAFATVWDYDNGRVGWITQLVVSLAERRRYIATSLLQLLKKTSLFRDVTAIGLVSSHPSACHALSKYTDISIRSLDLPFCQRNAKSILERSPVAYIRNMELRGSLFEDECTNGAVACLFTNFYVNHGEPLAALTTYKSTGGWVLGELLERHEFLIILPTKGPKTST